ncbi:MAG TPA: YigZ family protein [Candidatus Ornithoclostridium faecavium]|nr:YigZ family protein [Candidatus Ornithoclostridium faecavium]
MSDGYFCVTGRSEYEIVINRSRFITTLVPIENAEQAFDEIKKISKKYSDATHNCYAFVSNRENTEQRFSDDGEPQGTAGMPMLEVLKKRNVRMVLAVVTRYFGGIKLGAGGLVSAYSRSVSEALDNAKVVRCDRAKFYEVVCDYSDFRRLSDEAEKRAQITATEYGDKVTLNFAVTLDNENALIEKLTDVSSGKAQITYTGEGFFGFDK